LTAFLARVGLSAPAVSGIRMGLEPGRGRSALPVRSTIMGAALGVATIAGMVTFASSLHHLFDDPRLYGWNWDVQVGDAFAPDLTATARTVNARHDVAAVAVGTQQRLQIGALDVDAMGIQPLRGAIAPTVVAGRAPQRPGEILLGARTLRDLHVGVGDTVVVGYGAKQSSMRVVGRGVLTEFAGAARLGEGGSLTLAGMRRVVPDAAADVVLVRMRPGARVAGVLRQFDRAAGQNVYLPAKPSDLADLERVGGVPSVVAGLLGLMAVATLAHTLMASVSRRRRDLAILKVVGFERRQVSAAVAWQSSTVAVIAVVVGLPVGVAAGRWAWRLFANQLGVPPHPVIPLLPVALLLPGTVLLANLVAAVPARLAARTRPTAVLKAE
jgi:predicted lysophospholipase L1 biosynthesis ABC-type transport system permease subunit